MNFINCLIHPEHNIMFLYLLPKGTELLCESCLEDSNIYNELIKTNKLIRISSLLQKPEMIFNKLDFNFNELQSVYKSITYDNSSSINESIKLIEKQAQILQQQIQEMLQKLKNCIQNIEILKKQSHQEVIRECNFELLKELLLALVKTEQVTNPDEIDQLKLKLHQFFQQLQKDKGQETNNKIFTKIYQTSNRIDQEIKKLQTLDQLKVNLEQFHNDQYKIATSIYPYVTKQIQSILFSSYQQYKIIKLVKERQKLEIQDIKLIYLGSKDGLNAESFWSKVNGKKNLLMIFKSKSNYVFGAYSPSKWQQNYICSLQDNTNSSFLFSQTHDEIYPIKNNQTAIYCNCGYGPSFGHDMEIQGDFQGGYSKLGVSYKWDKYQNQYSTQLFGQSTPNVIECEIFEILFT